MWSYIARRLLAMVPTLFGVTVVSFCIMQLAPGDPLLNQLSSEGAQGQSSGTREAYLIQKRDLKLDKPLILNFRNFTDYRPLLQQAAYFLGHTDQELLEELERLQQQPDPARLEFLRGLRSRGQRLDIDQRLADQARHDRLLKAIQGFVRVYCEDLGVYGVPATMELLESETDLRTRIGLIHALDLMVVEPFQFTYSSSPSDSETPLVLGTWRTWWEREASAFPPLDPGRRETMQGQLQTMAQAESRREVFRLLDEEYYFERSDMRFFAENLLRENASLSEREICAAILKLFVANPMRTWIPLDASQQDVDEVTENWQLHYQLKGEQYQSSFGRKLWNVVGDTQYAHMVWRLVTFNFGRSALKTKEPVSEKLWNAFVISAPLMLMAELVIYFVAIPLGIVGSVNRGNVVDQSISLGLFFLYSIPPFVAGMLFLLFFCYGDYLDWFPMDRLHSDGADNFGYVQYTLDYLWHATLPVICLSLFSLAALAMYSRSSMLDVVGQDYIRTARAKGLPEWQVIYRHGLRNALIPVLTLFSNALPALLGGSVLVEVIFGIPGMGYVGWSSIEQKDFPTLMALVYVQAIVTLMSILLTDILYVLVDPRISFSSQGSGS